MWPVLADEYFILFNVICFLLFFINFWVLVSAIFFLLTCRIYTQI